MATSATPTLIRGLLAVANAGVAAGVIVSAGLDISNQQADIGVYVGSDDISVSTPTGASNEQTMATAGTPRSRSQDGSIPCAAYVRSGDATSAGLLAAMDLAYAQMAIFEAAFRADQRIGIGGYQLVVMQLGNEQLIWSQVNGSEVLLMFNVATEVRI